MPLPLDSCLPEDLPAALWQRAEQRPRLSGEAVTVDTPDGRFRLHFTESGGDAPPDVGEGVPASARRVLTALRQAEQAYLAQGFREIPRDSGFGGSDAIDVYLMDIDANGYAYPSRADDPDAVSACWIELEPGLADSAPGVLESVAAHELHHCVQFAYTVQTHAWMYEATATWAQYAQVNSPDLQVLLDALYIIRLGAPERPLASTDGRFEYAGLLLPRFWAERGPGGLGQAADPAGVVALWEALEEAPKWREGLELSAQRRWGQSLDQTFAEYSAWNAFACANDDGLHYDPDTLPCTADAGVPIAEAPAGTLVLSHPDTTHTALYTALGSDTGALAVSCEAPGAAEEATAGALLLGLDAAGAAVDQAWAAVGAGEVQAQGERFVLVSTSTGSEPVDVECSRREVVLPGRGCSTTGGAGALGWVWVWGVVVGGRRGRR